MSRPLYAHMLNVWYLLCCLCLKIINCSCRLFLMEEREQNKLCHLFMGDLEEQWEKERQQPSPGLTWHPSHIYSVWKSLITHWASSRVLSHHSKEPQCFQIWKVWGTFSLWNIYEPRRILNTKEYWQIGHKRFKPYTKLWMPQREQFNPSC